MNTLRVPEDQPIEAKLISGAIESAQSKIEGMNFDIRKHVLEYDDVMNKHRETIYRKRREILEASPERLREKIIKMIESQSLSRKDYEDREKEIGPEDMRKVEKIIALRTLDFYWMDHLGTMEHLRDSVRLRAYGQQDPLIEYKTESHRIFQRLLRLIESAVAQAILKPEVKKEPASTVQFSNVSSTASFSKIKNTPGRNEPCPCGSNKKYKKCCWPKYG